MAAAPGGEVIVYEAPDGEVRVDMRLERETVWLTQEQMAELFGRERSVVTKHVRDVFKEGELDPEAVRAKFAHTAADGKTYQVDHFNLDVIISVGYRVKSRPGTVPHLGHAHTARTPRPRLHPRPPALRGQRRRAGGGTLTHAQGSGRRAADYRPGARARRCQIATPIATACRDSSVHGEEIVTGRGLSQRIGPGIGPRWRDICRSRGAERKSRQESCRNGGIPGDAIAQKKNP